MTDKRVSFHTWVAGARPRLRRTAYLLCGDWHQAEDLVQETLVRVYSRWNRLIDGNPDGYARATVVNAYRSALRRPWRRESTAEAVPERVSSEVSETDRFDQRDALYTALMKLGRSQREIVVLRYWDDLSVAEVADTLNLSAGTVKSQAARGLERLREALTTSDAVAKGDF